MIAIYISNTISHQQGAMSIEAAHSTSLNKMLCRIVTMILVARMVSIHCYPINKEVRRSAINDPDSIVTMSNTVRDLLIEVDNATISNSTNGLLAVYIFAGELGSKDDLYIPEVASYNYIHMHITNYSLISL